MGLTNNTNDASGICALRGGIQKEQITISSFVLELVDYFKAFRMLSVFDSLEIFKH